MTRISKKAERKARSPRRPRIAGQKTGPKKDNLKNGYKEKLNAVSIDGVYISKL